MIKKIISYSNCAVGLACASLFVEGAVTVQVSQNVSQHGSVANEHEFSLDGSDFGGRANNKLIFAYGFEEDAAGWSDVSVKLRDNNNTEHAFSLAVNTQGNRAAGLFYLDVSETLSTSIGGAGSALIVDFGDHSNGTGEVETAFAGVLMSVSGLASGGAAYSANQAATFGDGTHDHPGANNTDPLPGTSTYEIGFTSDSSYSANAADGLFVTTAFTTNSTLNSSDSDNNTYTDLYSGGSGSSGTSIGYITQYDYNDNELDYQWTNKNIDNRIAYAAWAAAIPEPSQASALIAILTICFYTIRRRVA